MIVVVMVFDMPYICDIGRGRARGRGRGRGRGRDVGRLNVGDLDIRGGVDVRGAVDVRGRRVISHLHCAVTAYVEIEDRCFAGDAARAMMGRRPGRCHLGIALD